MGVCNSSMFCCTLLHVHSSFAIILMGKRELMALLSLSSWCLVIVVWLFFAVPWACLQVVIVVFLDHTHYFPWAKERFLKIGNKDWWYQFSRKETSTSCLTTDQFLSPQSQASRLNILFTVILCIILTSIKCYVTTNTDSRRNAHAKPNCCQ